MNEGVLSTLLESPRKKASGKIDGRDELTERASHPSADTTTNVENASEILGIVEALCLLDLAKNAQKWGMDLAPVSWQSTVQEMRLILLQPPVFLPPFLH